MEGEKRSLELCFGVKTRTSDELNMGEEVKESPFCEMGINTVKCSTGTMHMLGLCGTVLPAPPITYWPRDPECCGE